MNVVLNGREYPLATNLRVAYMIQGQHDHKPYAEVFKGIDTMPVEQQIGMIYAAFKVANPEASNEWPQLNFVNYFLDNMNLKNLMDLLQAVIKGIMGEDEADTESSTVTSEDAIVEGN